MFSPRDYNDIINLYNGLRTKRTDGSTTYDYIYLNGLLTQMTVGSNTLRITYDANGPLYVDYNGTIYYYVTNLQGDVIALVNTSGTPVVEYTYDAWGKILSTGGTLKDTLGEDNPLRYRGYVYDTDSNISLYQNVSQSIQKCKQYLKEYESIHGSDYLIAFTISSTYTNGIV